MKKMLAISIMLFVLLPGYGQTRNYRAKKIFYRGTEMIYLENYRQAIRDFTEAIKLDSGFLEAYENRGVAKYYMNDFRGSIEDYNRAIEMNPFDYETYGRRGWSRFSLREYDAALSDFTKALNGVADESKYHLIRGQTKHQLRDFNGALTDFDWVIKSMYSTKIQKSKAYYWMGIIKIDAGQKETGCNDLQEARKLGLEEAEIVIKANCNSAGVNYKN
jgi:serine/threonine-protein kinase